MRILAIGATGTIGSAVVGALGERGHEVLGAGSRRGTLIVDLGAPSSIKSLFAEVGNVDAVVSTAGQATFGGLDELTDDDWTEGLGNKLMGQINLVRFGRPSVRNGGSFTLTSGILAERPHAGSALLSTVNSALHGFVGAAALQLHPGHRINVVSPPLVTVNR